MEKKVKLTLEKKGGDKFVVEFDNLRKIDNYISTLQTMRAELERRLEAGGDEAEEECDCPHCRFMSLVAEYLSMPQEDQKETSFAMLHALLDYLFVESECEEDKDDDDEHMVVPVKLKKRI